MSARPAGPRDSDCELLAEIGDAVRCPLGAADDRLQRNELRERIGDTASILATQSKNRRALDGTHAHELRPDGDGRHVPQHFVSAVPV